MNIYLDGIGKKFNTEWIFRNVSLELLSGGTCAILGRNGSGKSTLLQIIAGSIHPTSGTIRYELNGRDIPDNLIFRELAMVAPYLEMIEDFTLEEMLDFHFSFKSYLPGINANKLKDILDLKIRKSKTIRQYSSGMKQRVKLALAFFSDVPLLLLDEPVMNLDKAGMEWYLQLVKEYSGKRTLIICSNQHAQESAFAVKSLQIEDFKS
ncbi:MAG: ABC transporter ATP-binding protein [Bacteroidetes bacterium]|nr:ABC transporter ATP-binding protein [Bacteroidota bacterium]